MKKNSVTKEDKKKKKKISAAEKSEPIVIDKTKGLVFQSEEEVYEHFSSEIEILEQEYQELRKADDIAEDEVPDFEERLGSLFEHPDEVWVDKEKFKNFEVYTYIKSFESNGQSFYYVALTYIDDHVPSFIFLHFPTRDQGLLKHYRRGDKIFSFEQHAGSGDALSEGDPLAIGLYRAMLTVRSETDIAVSEFPDYLELRDDSVENADEIWRSPDSTGRILVSFIKEFTTEDEEESLYYVVITLEDEKSETHYVLFSFPTTDKGLVDRYRHGEKLSSEEVVQEESH